MVREFTFAGKARGFHAINFGFDTADGRHFALYLSAPVDRWSNYVGVHETVRDGIDTGDGSSAEAVADGHVPCRGSRSRAWPR